MQAALNIMREQRRVMLDVHRQLLADEGLKLADPAHWRQLTLQALAETRELAEAIDLIARVDDGRLVEVAGEARAVALGAWPEIGPRRLVAAEARQ